VGGHHKAIAVRSTAAGTLPRLDFGWSRAAHRGQRPRPYENRAHSNQARSQAGSILMRRSVPKGHDRSWRRLRPSPALPLALGCQYWLHSLTFRGGITRVICHFSIWLRSGDQLPGQWLPKLASLDSSCRGHPASELPLWQMASFGRLPRDQEAPWAERSCRDNQCTQRHSRADNALRSGVNHGTTPAQITTGQSRTAARYATIHAIRRAIESRARSPHHFSRPDCQGASILS
jgi:hypothetical protein